MKTLLVSIIMPAYNVEKYLSSSIKSVLNQTYKNFELIIVDDGSTDNTLEIANHFAASDSRIKVLSQQNQKQGIARNNGFAHSNGDYIYFMDSDDLIQNNLLEYCITEMEKENADLINFSHIQFYEDNIQNKQFLNFELYKTKSIPVRQAIIKLSPMVQEKFFSREVLLKANLHFPSFYYEDNAEIYRVICFCEKIIISEIPLYYYRRRSDSTVGLTIGPNSKDIIKVAYRFVEIEKELPEFKLEFENMAYVILRNYIHAWDKINETWVLPAKQEALVLYNDISKKIENNPYYFVEKNTEERFENSFSWKITKPLRKIKEILRK